jgi:hypothetical protein
VSAKGYREAASAVLAAVVVGLGIALVAWLLTGCAGGEVYAKYSHRSSIPDYYDLHTSDTLGGCVAVKLCKTCGEYAPEMHGCVNYEVTGKSVYGAEPSGELAIYQPIKRW